ncbi:serine/threonine/tyrosine-protein kinase HT1-like [Carex rostrata]
MKTLQCLKPNQGGTTRRLERRLSLGEYKRAISWSKYLVSSGGAIKGVREDEWSCDMSQLLIGNKFASGRYSRIYHGIYKEREVAIKMISQPEEDAALAAQLEQQFTSEVGLLFRLRHTNIIKFVAACKRPPVFCIITEYMSGGSLRKYLHKQGPNSLPLKTVLKIALDVAQGMNYLHSQGILHRDLKSENILLGDDMSVKVADFGISCVESECGTAKGFASTYRWMAPEMIKEKSHTKKVDVYSFGVVLWELLTGLVPFNGLTPEQAAFAVAQKNARPPMPTSCPIAISHLINQCWASNPLKRPDFDKIVSILESYKKSLDEDPTFFLSYNPVPVQEKGLKRCFPLFRVPHRNCASSNRA